MGLSLGADIGSVALKLALFDTSEAREVFTGRFEGDKLDFTRKQIEEILSHYDVERIGVTGAGYQQFASIIGAEYINPNTASVKANMLLYPDIRTILKVGGSSSALITLDGKKSDIITPPHCSAGTGSFLEQTAGRFKLSIEDFANMGLLAEPEKIAGTCAVFAGSDMINAQQKGATIESIAAGLHLGLARNLFSMLVKGKNLNFPFSIQDGLGKNPSFKRAIEQILLEKYKKSEVIIPQYFMSMSAIGAAINAFEKDSGKNFDIEGVRKHIGVLRPKISTLPSLSLDDKVRIYREKVDGLKSGDEKLDVYVGLDVGSVSTNVAVVHYDKNGQRRIISKKYVPTASKPIEAINGALLEVREEIGDRINVLDVCVTGSGRKLIGNYLGGIHDVDEISAHKTGAWLVAKEKGMINADEFEIFEIGGQDSKYIRINKGVLVDFGMNKACAAGTGSFVEEQSKILGVIIQEFAKKALASKSPVFLGNDKCTVLIEEQIKKYKGTVPLEDLLSGVAYSIARNYLNEFKIGDRQGRTIFFQGGVALNDAVIAATKHLTGATIIVPPHNEVMGAIGAAEYARKFHSEKGAGTSFVGLDALDKRNYELGGFDCKACANACRVSTVKIEGQKTPVFMGDRCEKYSLGDKKDEAYEGIVDLFAKREELLIKEYIETGEKTSGTIGIPRLFSQYHDYFPLFKAFFESLGYNVVSSSKTNNTLVQAGLENVVAETCFPAEITFGHIKDLEGKVDHVFFPSIISAKRTGNERKTNLCPQSQGMPFAAAQSMPELEGEVSYLSPTIQMHPEWYDLDLEMIKIAKQLGKTEAEAKNALGAGLKALEMFNEAKKKLGAEALASIPKEKIPVALVGRAYTLFDPLINPDMQKMIMKSGGFPIPMDILPLDEIEISVIQDKLNWTYGHKVLKAAKYLGENKEIKSIFLTPAFCGPDAALEGFYKKMLGGLPSLSVEVGKNTPTAHVLTRIEAFLRSVKEQNESSQIPEYAPEPFIINTPLHGRTLYIPNMDSDVPVFQELLKIFGIESRALKTSSVESLAFANRYIPEKFCLPIRLTAGDYLELIQDNEVDLRKAAFFNNQADGSCRQKTYHLVQQILLTHLGYDIPVVVPQAGAQGGYARQLEEVAGRNFTRIDALKFFSRFTHAIPANEAARQLVMSNRPYELSKGSVDEAYDYGLKNFLKVVENGDINKGAKEFISTILSVPVDKSKDGKPVIGIVGEGYVRVHEPSNGHAIKQIEELGGVAALPMTYSYLKFVARTSEMYPSRTASAIKKMVSKLAREYMERAEHQSAKHADNHLVFPEPHIADIVNAAREYIDPKATSEAVEGIGLASMYARSGKVNGILNLIPEYCMPGSLLQNLLYGLSRKTGVPTATLPLTGIGNEGAVRENLEILYEKALEHKRG